MSRFIILKRNRRTPLFNIGMASRLTGLPVYTLRWVERAGLVSPQRTEGNQRLFSERDVEVLEMVGKLLEKRVNLSGIRIILEMRTGSVGKKAKR